MALRRSPRLAERKAKSDPAFTVAATKTALLVSPPRRQSPRSSDKRDSLTMLPSSPKPRIMSKSPETNITSILAVTPDTSYRSSKAKSRRLTIDPSRISRPSSTVKFGKNISALYHTTDPPNRFELLPVDVKTGAVEDAPIVAYDEETRRNEAILAEWDDVSDASSDNNNLDSDLGIGDVLDRKERVSKDVKEEEIQYLIPADSPTINTRRRDKRNRRSSSSARKLVKQTEVVCCKHCNRGVIRTTEYIYE